MRTYIADSTNAASTNETSNFSFAMTGNSSYLTRTFNHNIYIIMRKGKGMQRIKGKNKQRSKLINQTSRSRKL